MNEMVLLLQCALLTGVGFFLTYNNQNYAAIFTSLMVIMANMFIVKQIDLFGLHVTASDAYFIAAACTLNMVQEMYGKQVARNYVHISFGVLILFALLTQLQFFYTPNVYDQAGTAFETVFNTTLRISLVSLVSYWLTQQLDVVIYRFARNLTYTQSLACFFSVAFTQLLDTVFFSVFALSSIVASVIHVIVFSYLVKLVILTFSVAVMSALYRLLDLMNDLYESRI
tara:strand:+ start:91 stop:771 length:681 start_codon:yes stop_codon:yes gene_type:complete